MSENGMTITPIEREFKALADRVRAAEAERDRYKAALEKIAKPWRGDAEPWRIIEARRRIARNALSGEGSSA